MKTFLLMSLLFLATIVNAKNYYISSAGNDANNGLSQLTPWKTIGKVNASFAGITAGDSILFKRGDTFYGSLIVSKSGTPGSRIVIGAYATGANPVITGFTNASGWTNVGTNLWQSSVIGNKNIPNVVTINGADIPMGRYPNTGYLSWETSSGDVSITDNELNGTPNWTGAELVVKRTTYQLSRDSITNHSGNTITYPTGRGAIQKNCNGYFIQKSLLTLDVQNEWYFNNSTRKITVYSSGIPSNVNVSTIDTLINILLQDYITIDNITLEGGNVAGISGGGYLRGRGVVIKNCTINFSGRDGIFMKSSLNCFVQNCSINNSHNNGILFTSTGGLSDNITIENNYVNKSGFIPGMGHTSYSYRGICILGNNALIQYNIVDTSGYHAIQYDYNNSKIKYNKINHYCSVLDDGGGIYTWTGSETINYTGRKVIGNIITNGIGSSEGKVSGGVSAHGIYADDGSNGITIDSNSISNSASSGIFLHNARNLIIRYNKVYGANQSQLLLDNSAFAIRNIVLQNNEFLATSSTAYIINYSTIRNDVDSLNLTAGAINNNYYCRPSDENLTIHTTKSVSGAGVGNDYKLTSWKGAYPAYDANSHISPIVFPTYVINSYVTANLITYGQMTSDINGFSYYSGGTNVVKTWDGTSKITGSGSMKLTPATSSTQSTYLYSSGSGIGAISSAKKYLVRVTTLGTGNGILKAYLRQNSLPYTTLSSIQVSAFGTSKKVHEFLITDAVTNSAATFVFEIQENSGITYLDDIELYEVNASTIDNSKSTRFEYNASKIAKTITLDAKYISPDSTSYNGSITLQPYSSAILFKSGIITSSFTADAGTDISLILPTNSTLLKGSATGTVTNYSWIKISGPSQFTIASPNNPSTVISNLAVGKYTFQLKVINSLGESAFDTVNVVTLGVLPVTLIDFTAQNNTDKIELNWLVASELNVSHYTIERSSNGQNFEGIGKLNANNLFNTKVNYSFDDNFPLQGVNYYRLVMTDNDGTFKYSKTISVSVKNAQSFTVNNLSLSPLNKNIKIEVNSNYQQVMHLVVADVSGRIIYANPLQLQKGFNTIDKKIPTLNTGIYYAKLFTSDQIITKTLLSGH